LEKILERLEKREKEKEKIREVRERDTCSLEIRLKQLVYYTPEVSVKKYFQKKILTFAKRFLSSTK